MANKENSCAFTGHRETKLVRGWHENMPECKNLKAKLAETVLALYLSGKTHFISGMAHGCDMYFAEAVLYLKKNHPDVTLEAAIPFLGQADKWSGNMKNRYLEILKLCDKRTLVQREYTRDCMMRRNKYMVDNASVLVAVYNGSAGGTRNTILYAMRSGIELVEITI